MVERPSFVLTGEPALEFQPVVDLSDGRLLGMEALVRWNHPTRGLIPPNLLIPWAEANGDILPLGAWVLAEACDVARGWSTSVQLGVNCSVVQLRHGAASKAVRQALEQSGLDAGQLTIEVTEHSIADRAAAADLEALRAIGVQLAVDDVGTSWSSFDPLRHYAVDTVKIDDSFVAGLEPNQGINRLVVETVIHMAHSIGMVTIVEGVETAEQVAIVQGFGADAAQGYFFARPLPHDAAGELASARVLPRFSRTEQGTFTPVPVPPVVRAAAAAIVAATEDGGEDTAGGSGPAEVPSVTGEAAAPPGDGEGGADGDPAPEGDGGTDVEDASPSETQGDRRPGAGGRKPAAASKKATGSSRKSTSGRSSAARRQTDTNESERGAPTTRSGNKKS